MTQQPFHQMVWIDHQLARIFGVTRDNLIELAVIHAPDEGRGHVHHRAGTMGPGHVPLSNDFLKETASTVQEAQEILIIGPADAKHALKKYIALNMPRLDKRIIGVEPMDKCDPGTLQGFASLFFRHADLLRAPPR